MDTFVWMGAAFTVAGLVLIARTMLFLQRAETVPGKVIALAPYSGGKGTTYSPKVEYTTQSGTFEVTSDARSSRPRAKVGDMIPVKVDPRRPDQGRLARPIDLWGLGGLFALLGVTFLLTGLG